MVKEMGSWSSLPRLGRKIFAHLLYRQCRVKRKEVPASHCSVLTEVKCSLMLYIVLAVLCKFLQHTVLQQLMSLIVKDFFLSVFLNNNMNHGIRCQHRRIVFFKGIWVNVQNVWPWQNDNVFMPSSILIFPRCATLQLYTWLCGAHISWSTVVHLCSSSLPPPTYLHH